MPNPESPLPPKPESSHNLRVEEANTPEGHRLMVWLWVIGIVIFSLAIWGIAKLSMYIRPPHGV